MTEQPKKETVESESSTTPDDGSNVDASPVQQNKKRVSFGNLMNEYMYFYNYQYSYYYSG